MKLSVKTILIAPDSYKGCLSSRRVGEAMEKGIKSACAGIETIKLSASDGGDGFCECMRLIYGGDLIEREVTYPDFSVGKSHFLFNRDSSIAFIELAAASGITLVKKDKRDPLKATTLGTGELISAALLLGAKRIVVGLGGSATTDCGTGILHALGYRFFDSNGDELAPCGASLERISSFDSSRAVDFSGVEFIAACDVNNPLYGKNGAAYVFAPQKGADAAAVERLDKGLKNAADVMRLRPDQPGAGAAGGCGAAMLSVLNAKLVSGAELFVDSNAFSDSLDKCECIFTGEGRTDSQTVCGKLISAIANKAKRCGKPVFVISGAVNDYRPLYDSGVTACFSVASRPMSIRDSFAHAETLIAETAENLTRAIISAR